MIFIMFCAEIMPYFWKWIVSLWRNLSYLMQWKTMEVWMHYLNLRQRAY